MATNETNFNKKTNFSHFPPQKKANASKGLATPDGLKNIHTIVERHKSLPRIPSENNFRRVPDLGDSGLGDESSTPLNERNTFIRRTDNQNFNLNTKIYLPEPSSLLRSTDSEDEESIDESLDDIDESLFYDLAGHPREFLAEALFGRGESPTLPYVSNTSIRPPALYECTDNQNFNLNTKTDSPEPNSGSQTPYLQEDSEKNETIKWTLEDLISLGIHLDEPIKEGYSEVSEKNEIEEPNFSEYLDSSDQPEYISTSHIKLGNVKPKNSEKSNCVKSEAPKTDQEIRLERILKAAGKSTDNLSMEVRLPCNLDPLEAYLEENNMTRDQLLESMRKFYRKKRILTRPPENPNASSDKSPIDFKLNGKRRQAVKRPDQKPSENMEEKPPVPEEKNKIDFKLNGKLNGNRRAAVRKPHQKPLENIEEKPPAVPERKNKKELDATERTDSPPVYEVYESIVQEEDSFGFPSEEALESSSIEEERFYDLGSEEDIVEDKKDVPVAPSGSFETNPDDEN